MIMTQLNQNRPQKGEIHDILACFQDFNLLSSQTKHTVYFNSFLATFVRENFNPFWATKNNCVTFDTSKWKPRLISETMC